MKPATTLLPSNNYTSIAKHGTSPTKSQPSKNSGQNGEPHFPSAFLYTQKNAKKQTKQKNERCQPTDPPILRYHSLILRKNPRPPLHAPQSPPYPYPSIHPIPNKPPRTLLPIFHPSHPRRPPPFESKGRESDSHFPQ